MANLIDDDRIDVLATSATHAEGRVVPNSGSALLARPDPGAMSGVTTYDLNTLDPDPLYVGVLQPLVIPEPATAGVLVVGAAAATMRRRRRVR
jgi:hypothetical protein